MTDVDGIKIRMLYGGYERTVPNIDVMHYHEERVIESTTVEDNEHKENAEKYTQTNIYDGWSESNMLPKGWKSKDDNEDPNIPEGWKHATIHEGWKDTISSNLENNRNLRPKLNEIVEFVINGVRKTGRVVKVGKKTGREKNRCWITEGENETSYDFVSEVDNWKLLKNVTFSEETKKTKQTATKENEETGVNYLKNCFNVSNYSHRLENENEVFVTQIPKKFHDHPQIVEAKKQELLKWKEYDAVDQVTQGMDMNVLSSRWVVTEKGEDEIKARLVVRGFEEEIYPQSDSPTASKDSFKIFLALAANQEFPIKVMDAKSAFLQGATLDRNVFMEPPIEIKKPGIVWKLRKSVYGLYDASRRWYLAVKTELKNFGMECVSGDEAFFSMRKDGELFGMTVLHVDDFLVAGKPEFLDTLGWKLKTRFTFGKIELNKFKFTGLNIEQKYDGIYVDQMEYIQSIKPISTQGLEAEENTMLTKPQFKEYRRLTGQLAWAVQNTRPDLAFDVRHMATRNKDAQISDIQNANKILKRAKAADIKVKYSKIGEWKDLKLVTFTDSSFKNSEDKVRSVGGRVTFLMSSRGLASPLSWKSKTIQQVCKSVKSAETRSLEQGMEDSIYSARIIHEIMTGKAGHIPVEHKIDSKTLLDSVLSTKPIEEKTMRHLIAWMKQQLEDKTVRNIDWIPNQLMLADILTKKGVKADPLLRAVTRGKIFMEA